MNSYRVGDRVHRSGAPSIKGTVRAVLPIAGEVILLGVEWDEWDVPREPTLPLVAGCKNPSRGEWIAPDCVNLAIKPIITREVGFCKTCIYFSPDSDSVSVWGRCRINPPTMPKGAAGEWPTIRSSEWCGKWARK